MDYITKWINVEEDGLYLVFGITKEEQLKFVHFSSKPMEAFEDKEQYVMEGYQLVQVSFSGYNRPYEKHGNKHIVTAPGYLLKYVDFKDERNEIGRLLTFVQKDDMTGAKVTTWMQFHTGTSTMRVWSEVVNEGEEEQTLEYISSFYYLGWMF